VLHWAVPTRRHRGRRAISRERADNENPADGLLSRARDVLAGPGVWYDRERVVVNALTIAAAALDS